MINNFLAQGKQPFITQTGSIDVYMFPAQRGLSEFCVVMVLISVPIMLFVKPCSACYCPAVKLTPTVRSSLSVSRALRRMCKMTSIPTSS